MLVQYFEMISVSLEIRRNKKSLFLSTAIEFRTIRERLNDIVVREKYAVFVHVTTLLGSTTGSLLRKTIYYPAKY